MPTSPHTAAQHARILSLPTLARASASPTTASPAAVWHHWLPKLLYVCHIIYKTALSTIWWVLPDRRRATCRFHLKADVEVTSTQLHLSTPEISHLLFLRVMDLDLPQNTGGSTMYRLSVLHFAPLSCYNYSAARAITYAWDTLLEGPSTSSMRHTSELFRKNGVHPIEDWGKTPIQTSPVLLPLLSPSSCTVTLLADSSSASPASWTVTVPI